MPTRLEVLDDAVKILGVASITLAGTLYVTLTSNRRERQKELRVRKWDVIQKSTAEFESASQVFQRLHDHYSLFRSVGSDSNNELRKAAWNHASGILRIELGEAVKTLHGLESLLVVLGARESAKKIGLFRIRAVGVQNACLHADPNLSISVPMENVAAFWQAALKCKLEALDAFGADYTAA